MMNDETAEERLHRGKTDTAVQNSEVDLQKATALDSNTISGELREERWGTLQCKG